jgi:uncharacterized protein (DUF1778 family)/GNAT superfamily N-acetyltransferase
MQLRPLSWLHKTSEHTVRTSTEQDILLRRAAEITSVPVTDFILQSACKAAELAVLDQRQFFVSGHERRQLIDLQKAEPAPPPALGRLLAIEPPWNGSSALRAPEPLIPEHSIHQFDCGKHALNDWLTHRARLTQLKGSAKTFVVPVQQRVIAYFSLTVGQIDSRELPAHGSITLDREQFPVPVILLTRLAVDQTYQGKGIGRALLREVLMHTLAVAEQAGVEALLTQPLNEQAAHFYMAHGFVQSPAAYKQLLLTIGDIQAAKAALGTSQPGAALSAAKQ